MMIPLNEGGAVDPREMLNAMRQERMERLRNRVITLPTAAQRERLAFLIEEMGEALHAAGKTLRHGFDSRNPLDDESEINQTWLEKELGNVYCAISLMIAAGDISGTNVVASADDKAITVREWMHEPENKAPPEKT